MIIHAVGASVNKDRGYVLNLLTSITKFSSGKTYNDCRRLAILTNNKSYADKILLF